jgi:phosphohistidine phosphatase SixA
MRSGLLVLLCAGVLSCASPSAPTAAVPATLSQLVAGGGYVLFFRHATRDASAISNDALLEADREGQCQPGSELTQEGRTDAIAIGAAFRRRAIHVERVLASPACRTQQMAELAFGDHETTAGLAWPEIWRGDDADALRLVLPRLLGTAPAPGAVVVLISHNGVLVPSRMGLDITLDQAEAAVFRPHGDQTFDFVGKIPKAEWIAASVQAR